MDDLRDIKKADSLSRLLDNHIVRTNPFGRNSSGEKSYSRAERLVAALHLITSHVEENEPIRKAIRATSIELLSNILSLRDGMRNLQSYQMHRVQATIRKLISFVRMLAVSGLTSIQNTDVIVDAIDELGNFLHLSQRTPLSESIVFSRDDLLSGTLSGERRTSPTIRDRRLPAEAQKDIGMSLSVGDRNTKDIVKDTNDQISRTSNMTTRRSEILAVLRSVADAGIRDVASSLPEYSEKMIQRELAYLVAGGQVKKTGLKRWSRYSIANSV
ncbi:MAG: hypothetical protein UY44_C0002G0050 [Candidatus Kaiserbacteria bacterium GW2011_GWA2_49_19]|uniref:HTH deoR-type domain-containing protein n=1 Tax=Candidatus Kaiserbacteria bacterium GW2011_GWA2_49_19 TaxID=1618669 RepID=A0A0G1VSZ8_9BACT|nr:MAG: hypothetical protein UY44_C0002G0050 [Candidatus Kaiserbacteria bacterium GW2011_GWA2_49_19]